MTRHQTKILPLLTWRGAIGDSELPSTTRHVALALSIYMSEKGDSAHPGPTRLSRETGLCLRAVKTALANLVDEGWLVVVEKGGLKGEKRHANEYRASIPATPLPLDTAPSTTRAGGAPVQEVHPCTEVTRASHVMTRAPDAGVPVHDVHPISSSNSPVISPITPPTPPAVKAKKKSDVPEPTPEFNAFWAEFPKKTGKIPALRAWPTAIALIPAEVIIDGAARYARTCESNGTEWAYIKTPGPWLNDCRWTDEAGMDSTLSMLARLAQEGRDAENVIDVPSRLELGQ